MEQVKQTNSAYCVNDALESKCLCSQAQRFFCTVYESECPYFPLREFAMNLYSIKTEVTLHDVRRSMCTILPVLYFFAIAQVVGRLVPPAIRLGRPILYFVIEFTVIAVPIVLSVNVWNETVEYFTAFMSIVAAFLFVHQRKHIQNRCYDLGGQRPYALTLNRTTTNILTTFCILAVDFDSFPTDFRKSRRYGAALMDCGIGFFVAVMGAVSRPPKKLRDMLRVQRVVLPLFVLGMARTIVIININYHQDEHEYGVHLNAFFTLGLTKLLGTVVSAIARKKGQLIPLGLAVLAAHELALQYGLSEYVMDVELKRSSFFAANREGLCSLPGFISIYILSTYYGHWIQTKRSLTFDELLQKLKIMALSSIYLWTLLITCAYTVGIARVTCNLGYVVWIFSMLALMTILFVIVFDVILNTILRIDTEQEITIGDTESLLKTRADTYSKHALPNLVEAINRNGLVFFLLGNLLTGCVNIFLQPANRSDLQGVLILIIYLLLSTGTIYIMYHYKLRIA